MNSSTNLSGLTRDSLAKEIHGSVNTALTAVDNTSADRIQNLSLMHQARVSRLKRTAASVTAKYGAKSTQAGAAQEALTASQTTVARLQVLHRQISTTAPQVAATGWTLHGRVYDNGLQPLSGQTVFLVDSQKNYQSAYGFAYTDSTGYFQISFPGNTPPPSGENAASAESSPEALFIQVANVNSKPAYLSTAAFQPRLGNATYQNITLPAGGQPLGDPPEEIRKVALPPPQKSS